MGFFIGQYDHSLDDKSRVIVPARLRDMIDTSEEGEGLYVCPGRSGCLFLYTRKNWQSAAVRMNDMARQEPTVENQNVKRFFFATSELVQWDRQGRILVPEALRASAGLDKNVVFIGNGDRIELWDAKYYRQFHSETGQNYQDFAGRGF